MRNQIFRFSSMALYIVLASLIAQPLRGSDQVDFQRDIRPILSNHCFQCHGPDDKTREAELRLDLESAVIEELGGKAISRQTPGNSPLLQRIHSSDAETRMPPDSANKPLSDHQRDLLRRWVEQGANWKEHWAYRALQRPSVPGESLAINGSGAIDAFVRQRLQQERLQPSPSVDRVTLARRLSFDLLGLPPEPTAVDAFVADRSPDAVHRYVDRLLASPHFGERLALYWFDLVRFANSIGIHSDNEWTVTPYRNWVIDAFNTNMPFDQFTREQLAGDLLPNATLPQKVAATYNRLNLITAEGGSQAKEFLVKYTADRVRNASSVWLATTMGCAECHNHKFDPLTSREFYQFGAFFADIQQRGVYSGDDHGPYLEVPSATQVAGRVQLEERIAAAKRRYEDDSPAVLEAFQRWQEDIGRQLSSEPTWTPWHSVGPFPAGGLDQAHAQVVGPEAALDQLTQEASSLPSLLATTYGPDRHGWQAQPNWKDGEITDLHGDNSATYLFRTIAVSDARHLVLKLGSDDGIRVWLNGKQVFDRLAARGVKADEDTVEVDVPPGVSTLMLKVSNGGGKYGFYFRALGVNVPGEIADIVRITSGERTAEQQQKLQGHFRSVTPLLQEPRERLQAFQAQLDVLNRSVLRTIATVATDPLPIRVLPRGNWMDDTGEVVSPGIPAVWGTLPSASADTTRFNRLDLAEWLVDRRNPLTARVFVNRLWMLLFGAGISRSTNDFGAQGELPTHPELLDWLAVEFMDSGWDIKHMVRLMVLSETYAQTSTVDPALQERDPFNRLMARQTRFRLDGEFVRDIALAASNRLNTTVCGPSISKPYQPAGYYRHMNFPPREYANDADANQFRRGIYMHRQRMFLHPAMVALDAPSREECVAERRRSNTPLAALVLLNDPCFVEAARVLGTETMRQSTSHRERLQWMFRRVLTRLPNDQELNVLERLWQEQRDHFASDQQGAIQLISVGITPVPHDFEAVDLAAWTVVGRTLLNMHESITRL